MSMSWEVWLRHGKWGLYIRNYFAQGLRPDYALFKEIDESTAIDLVSDGLAGDLYGQVNDLLKRSLNQTHSD